MYLSYPLGTIYKRDGRWYTQGKLTNSLGIGARSHLQSPTTIMASSAAGSSSTVTISSITNLITIRLTHNNFLIWKTQTAPALHAAHLYGYVYGTIVVPPETITKGIDASATMTANTSAP